MDGKFVILYGITKSFWIFHEFYVLNFYRQIKEEELELKSEYLPQGTNPLNCLLLYGK